MEERVERVFTITRNNSSRREMAKRALPIFIAIIIVLLTGCSPRLSDDPIPYQPFQSLTLNLNLPDYLRLKTDGGFKEFGNLGIRGVIVYRKSATEYLAFEKNCSYQPNSACATVGVDISTLFLIDDCCHSTFALATGEPTGGPAWRPLRQYQTILNGSDLTITDEILQ
jgi:hypothetical protein